MSKLKNKIGEYLGGEKFSASALTAAILAVIIAVNVVLYAVVELFGGYFYKPLEFDASLSGSTDALFAPAIEEGRKVKISFCMPEKELAQHETGYLVYETAKYYEERYPELIELDYINIITRRNDDGELIKLSKYQKDMRGEDCYVGKTSVIFETDRAWRVITDRYTSAGFADFYTLNSANYASSYNGEEVIAALISWVLSDEHKSAYFTLYHGEVADVAFANLLACAGYYIDYVDLRKENVPDDADLLVISNPTSDFEQRREGSDVVTEMERIKAYMESGGNLYVALDPYAKQLPVLESYLATEGIEFSYSTVENGTKVRTLVKDLRNAITTDGFTLVAEYASNALAGEIENTVSSYSDGRVIVREASALNLSGNAKAVLMSSASSVLEAGGKTVSTDGSYCLGAVAERETNSGAVARVFVIPSVYLAVSDSLVTNGYSNKDFCFALMEHFFGAENLPYGCKNVMFETGTLENLTMGAANVYTTVIMLIPVAIAIVGTVVTVRRKNR